MIWFLIRFEQWMMFPCRIFHCDETFQRAPYRAFDSSGLNAWMCCNQWIRPTQIESCHQQIRDFIYGYMYRSPKILMRSGIGVCSEVIASISVFLAGFRKAKMDELILPLLFCFCFYKLSFVIPIANVVFVMMDENMCVRVSVSYIIIGTEANQKSKSTMGTMFHRHR